MMVSMLSFTDFAEELLDIEYAVKGHLTRCDRYLSEIDTMSLCGK